MKLIKHLKYKLDLMEDKERWNYEGDLFTEELISNLNKEDVYYEKL